VNGETGIVFRFFFVETVRTRDDKKSRAKTPAWRGLSRER
jgi:hypothetical protein